MTSTCPCAPLISMYSPTRKLFTKIIVRPATRFLSTPCIASPTPTPATPSPAMSGTSLSSRLSATMSNVRRRTRSFTMRTSNIRTGGSMSRLLRARIMNLPTQRAMRRPTIRITSAAKTLGAISIALRISSSRLGKPPVPVAFVLVPVLTAARNNDVKGSVFTGADANNRRTERKWEIASPRIEFCYVVEVTRILMAIALVLVWSGCATAERKLSRFEYTQPQMGLPFRIVLYAPDKVSADAAANAAFARIKQLNDILSDYDTDSELSRLSQTAGSGKAVHVSDDLWRVLERSEQIARETGGAFDITCG